MCCCQLQQVVFTAHRFTAGTHIPVNPKLFALRYQLIHFFIGQVQGLAIFCSPAAFTMQVTGCGRIKQQDPGHVAVVFFSQLHHIIVTGKHAFITKVQHIHFQNMRIDLVDGTVRVLHPFSVWILHKFTGSIKCTRLISLAQQRLCQIDQLDSLFCHMFCSFSSYCFNRCVDCNTESGTLRCMYYFVFSHVVLTPFSLCLNLFLFHLSPSYDGF